MRILILGGSRFMGLSLTRELAAGGHSVAVLNRGQVEAVLPKGVARFTAQRDDIADIAAELRAFKPDCVVDMLCMYASRAQSLLEVFSGYCPQLVVASSMDVYQAFDVLNGEAEGLQPTPITEDSKLRERRYPYADKAAEAPSEALAEFWRKYDKVDIEETLFRQSQTAVTIIRLPMVYGERDFQHRMWNYIRAIQDGRPHIVLDEGAPNWRACRGYVDNMAHALALAAMQPASEHRLYVAAEPAMTESQWISGIAEAMGSKIEIHAVPREFWPPEHECQGKLEQHLDVDSSKIRRELGYSEIVSQPEAFRLSVAWEQANPPAQQHDAAKLYASEDAALAALGQATVGAAS